MLKLAASPEALRRWAERPADFCALRMASALDTYGMDGRYALYWLRREGDGAFCRVSGRGFALADTPPALAELLSFLPVLGGMGEVFFSGCLPAQGERLWMMRRKENTNCNIQDELSNFAAFSPGIEITDCDNLTELYQFLCRHGQLPDADYGQWLCDLSHRVRHGLAALWQVRRGEEPAAVMGVYARNSGFGLLGSGFTAPQWRGRGYAGALLRYGSGWLLRRGKEPCFACEEALRPYYEQRGFAAAGQIARLTPQEF